MTNSFSSPFNSPFSNVSVKKLLVPAPISCQNSIWRKSEFVNWLSNHCYCGTNFSSWPGCSMKAHNLKSQGQTGVKPPIHRRPYPYIHAINFSFRKHHNVSNVKITASETRSKGCIKCMFDQRSRWSPLGCPRNPNATSLRNTTRSRRHCAIIYYSWCSEAIIFHSASPGCALEFAFLFICVCS